MVQNLKVDIIYHQSPSDFEMEFNLGSSCHMRLLSDRTTDKKGLIKALVRGVARSRVIICCGPLFGAEGLVSIVAKAIGAGTDLCNNKTYGINSDEEINIIKGSTPLVTPDGYFGGCIIESGPQTIILLTENKTFRKSIMKTLSHPYMAEISYVSPNANIATAVVEKERVEYNTAVSENEVYITQDEENTVDDEEPNLLYDANDDQHNIEFVMDGENAQDDEDEYKIEEIVPEDTYYDMYTSVETEEIKERTQNPYTTSESDSMFISNVETDEVEQKRRKKDNLRAMDITIVTLALLILLAILAIVYLLVLRPVSMGVSVGGYIKEIFGIASSNTLV